MTKNSTAHSDIIIFMDPLNRVCDQAIFRWIKVTYDACGLVTFSNLFASTKDAIVG